MYVLFVFWHELFYRSGKKKTYRITIGKFIFKCTKNVYGRKCSVRLKSRTDLHTSTELDLICGFKKKKYFPMELH